jgi:Secretion system C-terminal sorting domain
MNSKLVYSIQKLVGCISLTLFLVAAKPDMLAQSGFAKAIPIDANVNIDDIIFHQDQLILRGNIEIDSVGLIGLLIAGIDTNGILLWKNVIYDTSLMSDFILNTPGRFLVTNDERLVLPVKYYNTGKLAVYFTTLEGEEEFHRFYEHGEGIIFPYDINQIENELYLTGVISYLGGDLSLFALKLRSNGDMVWIRYYGLPDLFEESIDADVNPDNTLTLYAARDDLDFLLSEGKEGWKQPWILTIDTSGSIVEEWLGEENDPRTLGGEYFFRMKNGDWIMQGTHYKNVPGQFGEIVKVSPTITRLDSEFNLVWKVYLTNYEDRFDQIFDMEFDALTNRIIVTGNRLIPIGNTKEYVNWTIKLDTAGSILWERTDSIYFSRQNTHYTAGLALSPNGAIYAGGYVSVYELEPRSQAFIIKYTADGCSDTLCTSTSLSEQITQAGQPFVMYPNPASDVLHILVCETTGQYQMQLSDLHGRVVSVSQIFTGSQDITIDLPAGVYIASFTSSTGIIYSRKLIVY